MHREGTKDNQNLHFHLFVRRASAEGKQSLNSLHVSVACDGLVGSSIAKSIKALLHYYF